jgi:ammonium transporter, Amt family
MLMTGIFATKTVNSAGADGWFYGNSAFFWTQVKALLVVVPFSFCVSFLIFKFINLILPIRVSKTEEEEGLDASQHAEKYMQGHLLVQTAYGVKEEAV